MTKPKVLIFDKDADWYASELASRCPGFDFRAAGDEESALAKARNTEILIALAPAIPPKLVAACTDLRWIQALTSGVDSLAGMEIGSDVAITNCRGIHGRQMSELAILFMMSLARRFRSVLENQQAARWERWEQPVLVGRTVCLLGLGAIAETLAGVCAAFGMEVTGVSDSRSSLAGVDRIYRRDELHDAAAEADFLVVLIPLSTDTRNIVDADVLATMKPGAFLINMARGGVVDEAALIEALDAGTIAGAALDVFETEPLPADSPFWKRDDVIVTPHIGGLSDRYHVDAMPVVAANLRLFAEGGIDALPHRLDRAARP